MKEWLFGLGHASQGVESSSIHIDFVSILYKWMVAVVAMRSSESVGTKHETF